MAGPRSEFASHHRVRRPDTLTERTFTTAIRTQLHTTPVAAVRHWWPVLSSMPPRDCRILGYFRSRTTGRLPHQSANASRHGGPGADDRNASLAGRSFSLSGESSNRMKTGSGVLAALWNCWPVRTGLWFQRTRRTRRPRRRQDALRSDRSSPALEPAVQCGSSRRRRGGAWTGPSMRHLGRPRPDQPPVESLFSASARWS